MVAHLSSASAQVRMSTLEAALAVAAILAIVAVGNAHLSAFLSNGGGSQQNAPPAAGETLAATVGNLAADMAGSYATGGAPEGDSTQQAAAGR